MDLSFWLDGALILAAGFIAGIINVMAGGGSLLTLPVLIFMGLPAAVANGTNRIAITVMSATGTINFHRNGLIDKKMALIFMIPGVAGSIVGANLALTISERVFHIILAIIMIVTICFIIIDPAKRWSKNQAEKGISKSKWFAGIIIFFFIGIYGGFIQAGAGFFIIAALTGVFGLSLTKSNALKLFISGVYVFVSLFVFLYHGEVNIWYGITLAIGMGTGGFVGSHLAVKKGDKIVKIFLVISVIAMATKLLFF
jgi:uncharacterized membrane protein YfcA